MIAAQAIRRSKGIPLDAFEIVSVGELNKNKNHRVIIEAISKLEMKDKIHYAIAGIGDQKETLENLAEALNVNLHLLGYCNDIPSLYGSADVCAFPSIREGLGMAAIEGMASGLPLVCSENRGTAEFLSCGVMLTQSQDIGLFAENIRELIKNRSMCIELGIINKEESRKFDIAVVNKKMKAIYKELLSANQYM